MMHMLSKGISKELLPQEKEAASQEIQGSHSASAAQSDHWTPAVLLERANYLRKMAANGGGSAGETLKVYPRHSTMLSFRNRDGAVERHENFADLFYVLDGRATLITGGKMVGAVEIDTGEMRGVSIEGGTRRVLRSGDVAHIPAGMPHQMLVSSEDTFTAFVMKIQESEPPEQKEA
jgi:uncharacterized RmlC-like cupin family protein